MFQVRQSTRTHYIWKIFFDRFQSGCPENKISFVFPRGKADEIWFFSFLISLDLHGGPDAIVHQLADQLPLYVDLAAGIQDHATVKAGNQLAVVVGVTGLLIRMQEDRA
jgi:hypothetical protein